MLASSSVSAASAKEEICTGAGGKFNTNSGKCIMKDDNGNPEKTLPERIQQIVNVLLFVIGAVSVIMIIIGGLRYTLSNGEAKNIESAKNTILYAVIGLLVAIFAYAIVGFVVDAF